jgi:hypothetical protein
MSATSAAVWRGITWSDVPGHDDESRKMNFSMLKRGLGFVAKQCRGLEGEELKARLQGLAERNGRIARETASRNRAEGGELKTEN